MADSKNSEWPFDAAQDDPLTALRIPVVRTCYPEKSYEVCLVISDEAPWSGVRPNDHEVKQILAYLDYRMSWYNPGWQAKMRQRPLDVDPGTNTVTLLKRLDSGWCYRKMSWTYGPPMVPREITTLEQVLDRINSFGDEKNNRWESHKAKYPGLFGSVASSGE